MVVIGKKKEIKDIEIIGRITTLDIVARHHFGISIISLSYEDAQEFREEIDEWLCEQTASKKQKQDLTA